jgi:hypothetical protein
VAEVSVFEASLGGVSLCLRLLRYGRGFSFGCVALRSTLKKCRKGPPSATSVALIAVKIDNERTIVRRDRFTRINRASHLPCAPCDSRNYPGPAGKPGSPSSLLLSGSTSTGRLATEALQVTGAGPS